MGYSIADLSEMSKKSKKKKKKHKRDHFQKELTDYNAVDNKSEKNLVNHASGPLEILNEPDINCKDYQAGIKTKRKKKKVNHDKDQSQRKPDNSSGDVMYSIADLSEMSKKSKKKKKKHKRDHYQKELTDYNAVDNKSEKNLDNHASGPLEILNEPDINCKDYQAGIETKRKKKKVNHDKD